MPQISSSCGFEHALWILRSEGICFHCAEKFKNILHFWGKKINMVCITKQYINVCVCAHTMVSMKLDAVGAPLRTNST